MLRCTEFWARARLCVDCKLRVDANLANTGALRELDVCSSTQVSIDVQMRDRRHLLTPALLSFIDSLAHHFHGFLSERPFLDRQQCWAKFLTIHFLLHAATLTL